MYDPRVMDALLSRLERRCQGVAALDAILSEDWEFRYFSFNARWSEAGDERMASMRDGEGDAWFLVFVGERAFFKGIAREGARLDPATAYQGLPAALEGHRDEPAFTLPYVTYGGWFEPSTGWILRGDPAPLAPALALLEGDPEAYCAYAAECFEKDLPPEAVARVLSGDPLDAVLLAQLAPERTLESLQNDLDEIGY